MTEYTDAGREPKGAYRVGPDPAHYDKATAFLNVARDYGAQQAPLRSAVELQAAQVHATLCLVQMMEVLRSGLDRIAEALEEAHGIHG